MRSLLSVLLIAAVLSGCAQYEYRKHGARVSEYEFQSDMAACQRDAAYAFPYAPQNIQSGTSLSQGPSTMANTNCMAVGNSVNCTTTAVPQLQLQPKFVTIDANDGRRNSYIDNCMGGKGWARYEVNNASSSSPLIKNYGYRSVGQTCSKSIECEGISTCVSGVCKPNASPLDM